MVRVTKSEATRFVTDCMKSIGCDQETGEKVGVLLIEADLKGHKSHGINRIGRYIAEIESGFCDAKSVPKILNETASTAWVDGSSALGVVVGEFCMNLAMEKCRETGVGWVSAKRSNHFGIAGHYSEMALKRGLIGMAFTNSPPLMVPTRAKEPVLGSNPIACAAPGTKNDFFSLDMATTCKAAGKIELHRKRGEKIPEGWAVDKDGNPTTDAEAAVRGQPRLMPLGGLEENSGYKGFGLGMMVDIFCGVLSGASYGHQSRKWTPATGEVKLEAENNFGQCFIALDPKVFAPGFEGRLQDLMNHCRGVEPADSDKPVKVPGDLERENLTSSIQSVNGTEEQVVDYHENQIKTFKELAAKHKVAEMKFL